MVSVIASAVAFVLIAALSSIAFSRYLDFRKHRQIRRLSADADAHNELGSGTTVPLNPANLQDSTGTSQAASGDHYLQPNNLDIQLAPASSEKGSSSAECSTDTSQKRTHRRSRHLISYNDDSDDDEDQDQGEQGGANSGTNKFSWKRFFLPARHIAFRHGADGGRRSDTEGLAGAGGYRLDSLSVSPSQPAMFGADEKDGGDGASMCVVLTPPSPRDGCAFPDDCTGDAPTPEMVCTRVSEDGQQWEIIEIPTELPRADSSQCTVPEGKNVGEVLQNQGVEESTPLTDGTDSIARSPA